MTREYFLEDPIHPRGGITIKCKDDTDCVFCEHCTDVFWDYTNLIYMILCDEEHDTWDRPCKYFKESDSMKSLCTSCKHKDACDRDRRIIGYPNFRVTECVEYEPWDKGETPDEDDYCSFGERREP